MYIIYRWIWVSNIFTFYHPNLRSYNCRIHFFLYIKYVSYISIRIKSLISLPLIPYKSTGGQEFILDFELRDQAVDSCNSNSVRVSKKNGTKSQCWIEFLALLDSVFQTSLNFCTKFVRSKSNSHKNMGINSNTATEVPVRAEC